jgi:serine/threonine protein kinase
MAYLHGRKFVHRDLKSDNCLLDNDNNVKVADFGKSRLMEVSSASLETIGTLPWMAPEVLFGDDDSGSKVDVYSFGIIMVSSRRSFLHHGLNSFCPEPTGALRIGVLSPRITCAYYQPHTKSQSRATWSLNSRSLRQTLTVVCHLPTPSLSLWVGSGNWRRGRNRGTSWTPRHLTNSTLISKPLSVGGIDPRCPRAMLTDTLSTAVSCTHAGAPNQTTDHLSVKSGLPWLTLRQRRCRLLLILRWTFLRLLLWLAKQGRGSLALLVYRQPSVTLHSMHLRAQQQILGLRRLRACMSRVDFHQGTPCVYPGIAAFTKTRTPATVSARQCFNFYNFYKYTVLLYTTALIIN